MTVLFGHDVSDGASAGRFFLRLKFPLEMSYHFNEQATGFGEIRAERLDDSL